jgi:ABC-2 type transport system permease protein
MYKFYQIFKMDLLNLLTNPMWVFYTMGFPFLLVLVLGFLMIGGYGNLVDSYDYYGITMLIFAILNTSTISANSFMEERIKSGNMRILHSPVRPFFVHFSKVLAAFAFATVCHFVAGVTLYFTVGVNFGGANIGYVIILMLLLEFFSSALGVMMCCALKSESITNQILSMVLTIFAVLGGLFFPLDGLGTAMVKISAISPVKWVCTAIFQMTYDSDFSLFVPTCSILAILSLAAILLSVKFFRTEDYI